MAVNVSPLYKLREGKKADKDKFRQKNEHNSFFNMPRGRDMSGRLTPIQALINSYVQNVNIEPSVFTKHKTIFPLRTQIQTF